MTQAQDAFARAFDVSRETLDRLAIYEQTLQKWSLRINLVAASTLDAIWSRHFSDSAEALEHAPAEGSNWVDLGSGAGFPGLVIAILAPELRPQTHVTLIESDARKCAFLSTAARAMSIRVNIINSRIEATPPQNADIISARALAPLDSLLEYAMPHLKPGGICLFHKGIQADQELTASRKRWTLSATIHPSRTGGEGSIVRVERMSRV